jgi:transposase-like protein
VKAQEIVHPDPIWEAGGCETPDLTEEARMDRHQNARTTPHSRAEMVRRLTEAQQPGRVVAQAFGISERTVRKWHARAYQARGLVDRSCRPHRSPRATPPAVVAQVVALRRARWTACQRRW